MNICDFKLNTLWAIAEVFPFYMIDLAVEFQFAFSIDNDQYSKKLGFFIFIHPKDTSYKACNFFQICGLMQFLQVVAPVGVFGIKLLVYLVY